MPLAPEYHFTVLINTGTTPGDGQGAGLRTNMRILIANDNHLKQKIIALENYFPAPIIIDTDNEVEVEIGLENTFPNLPEMFGNQPDQTINNIQQVSDSTGDPEASGTAYYIYLGTTIGDINDYKLLTPEQKASLDKILTIVGALNESQGADVSSEAETKIGSATGNFINVLGTTTITSFDKVQPGAKRTVRFLGALTLTHNSESLIIPAGQNVITEVGDVANFTSLGAGKWLCTNYTRKDGTTLAQTASRPTISVFGSLATLGKNPNNNDPLNKSVLEINDFGFNIIRDASTIWPLSIYTGAGANQNDPLSWKILGSPIKSIPLL